MPVRKTSSLKFKLRKRPAKLLLSSRAQHLEKAILRIRKKHPELAGYFVLTKAPSKVYMATEFLAGGDSGCKEWGINPKTGELVCIE